MSEPAINGNGSRRKGLLLLGVVFILGLACGSALTFIGVRTVLPVLPDRPVRPGGGPHHMGAMEQFRDLDLDPDQEAQIREIIDRSRGEVRGVLEKSRADIRAILTDEQREKFDEMRHRRPMRGRRRGPGWGPPPPPPPE